MHQTSFCERVGKGVESTAIPNIGACWHGKALESRIRKLLSEFDFYNDTSFVVNVMRLQRICRKKKVSFAINNFQSYFSAAGRHPRNYDAIISVSHVVAHYWYLGAP